MNKEQLDSLVRLLRKEANYGYVEVTDDLGTDWKILAQYAVENGADLNQIT